MAIMGRTFSNKVRFGRSIPKFVSVRSRNQGAQQTDSTTHVINLPEAQVGDVIYVAFSIDTATTVTSTTSTGWAKLASDKQGTSTNQTGEVWWKRATGSDAFTITSSTAEQSTHVSLAIANADDPEAVTANGAAAAAAVPPAINASRGTENYLCLVSTHTDSSAGTTQNFGAISGFDVSTTVQASTTTSAATNVQEELFLNSNGSIAPGTVSLSLAEQWVCITTVFGTLGVSAPTVSGSVSLTATPTLTVSGTVYKPPGSFFNLNNWKITVPYDGPDGDVNADEITQPTLNTYVDTQYFYLDASNQMVMDAPVNGDTTSGSTGVRTELREMDGAVESAWDKTTASRQLTVAGYFDPTNITGGSAPKKVMIVGQIHETGGTPGIYLTVDYDAVPSRLRVFKDGPGVGNLVTGFTPTDKLAFRIECTGGNVNIYGVIGNETALPAIPQFTFPASGFVEVTGSYLKTGAYNKTDTATGSTGDSIAKITYLNLNQALPVVWQATLSLTATPTLSINATRITLATVSLTATPTLTVSALLGVSASASLIGTPTLTVNGLRTAVASVSLTATPTLTVTGLRTAVSSVSLTATPTLTLDGIRTTPASITLTATPTISVSAPQLTAAASVSLIGTPTLSVDGVRIAPASISLTILPSLVIPGNLTEIASVSLLVTPTLSLDGIRTTPAAASLTATPTLSVAAQVTTPATVSLTATPTLSVNAVRITPATITLTATPTISVTAYLTLPASISLIVTPTATFLLGGLAGQVSLSATPTLTVNGLRTALPNISLIASPTLTVDATVITPTGANLSLTATPTLTVSALLTALANFGGIATPTLSVDATRITPATIQLTITPTISVTVFRAQTLSVSLIATPTLSATLGAAGASVSLTATPTIFVTPLYIARPTVLLTALPSLTVGAYLRLPATVSLTITPTLTVGFFGQTPASLALIVVPTLAVDATRYVPAALSLTVSAFLTIDGVRVTLPAIDLLITPTITLLSLRTTVSSVYLLITPTLYVKGAIEGAGPGWPIVFRVTSVDDGEEPVSSSQTKSSPSFEIQSVTNESNNVATVSKPYIDFEDVNA